MEMAETAGYFTKSARLKACSGLLARLATSSSAIVVELGGCDHLWADGEGWRARLDAREKCFALCNRLSSRLPDRNGLKLYLMVASDALVVKEVNI
jgi:hypothetical protein